MAPFQLGFVGVGSKNGFSNGSLLGLMGTPKIREKISLIQTEARVYIRGRAWLVRVFRWSICGVTSTPPCPLSLAEPAPGCV